MKRVTHVPERFLLLGLEFESKSLLDRLTGEKLGAGGVTRMGSYSWSLSLRICAEWRRRTCDFMNRKISEYKHSTEEGDVHGFGEVPVPSCPKYRTSGALPETE